MGDPLLRVNSRARAAATSVGVQNRMPQGSLVPFAIAGSTVFDDTIPGEVYAWVPDRMGTLVEARLMVRFRPFWAPVKAAVGTGTSTSTGASSATSSSAGLHLHTMGSVSASGGGGSASVIALALGQGNVYANADFTGSFTTGYDGLPGTGHDHPIPHTHNFTPTVTVTLTMGIYAASALTTVSVKMQVYTSEDAIDWTASGSPVTITALASEQDVLALVPGPGHLKFAFVSDAGTPDGGLLCVDVAGFVFGSSQAE